MANYPGSDIDELARYVETAMAIPRFAAAGDSGMARRALHQLISIVTGWCLSIELQNIEHVRQEELLMEQQRED